MTNPTAESNAAPELQLPPDLTEAQALRMLEQGAAGRIELEAQLRYSCCTIGGCLLPAGHVGACRVPDRSAAGGRKKTPKRIWEQDDSAPQQRKDPKRVHKQPSGVSRKSSAAASSAATAGSATCGAAAGSGSGTSSSYAAADSSFATAAFRNGAGAQDLVRQIDLVPNMRAAPSFLDSNAQSHPNPFSPIADLMDNGIEAKATEMRVGMHTYRGVAMLMMTDNGCGMTERVLRDGPLSLAYTFKEGTHYGMGATSSMPAIAGFSLIFSVTAGGHRTVGLLSSRLSGAVNADQTKMPQCTWVPAAQGDVILGDAPDLTAVAGDPEAPLGLAARRASLALLLEFSPYKTEHDLLGVFAKMPPHGTRLVMWDLRPCYQPAVQTHDVLNTLAPADAERHETSLRGLLEILYYVDAAHPPPLELWLMGEKVVPRDWSRYLHLSRRFALPKAGGSGKSSAGASNSTFVEFGHRVELRALIDNFRSRQSNKDTSLREYMGVFYYNRDADKVRLIVPLEKCKVQKPMAEGKIQMAVTQRRICEWGFGLLGVCVESHLKPAHNKREYASQATNSEFHALVNAVDKRMREHLKQCVAPEYVNCTGGQGFGNATEAAANRKLGKIANSPAAAAAAEMAPAKPPPPIRFMEGERVRAPDGKEGRVCPDASAKGFYRLQNADGTIYLGKRYRGSELTRCTFDERTDLPRGFAAAPDTLDGVRVEVYWLEEEGILGEGSWERGRLVRPVSTAHNRGWFTLIYDDQEVMDPEQMFFALPTAASRAHAAQSAGGAGSSATSQPFFAARPDGERLFPDKDIRILDASVASVFAVPADAYDSGGDAVLVHVDASVQSGDEDEVVDGEIMIDSSEVFVESTDDEMSATATDTATSVTAVVVPDATADATTAGSSDAAEVIATSIDSGGGDGCLVEIDELDGIVVQESDVPLGPSSSLSSSAGPPPVGRKLSAASRETARAPPPTGMSTAFQYPRVGLRMSSSSRASDATPANGSVGANGQGPPPAPRDESRRAPPLANAAAAARSNSASTTNGAARASSTQPPAATLSHSAAPSPVLQPAISSTTAEMVTAAQQVLKAEPPTAALAVQRRAVQALPLLPSDVARHRPVTTLAQAHAAGRRRAELVDASTQADLPPLRHNMLGRPAVASTAVTAVGEEEEEEEEVVVEEEEDDEVEELLVQLRAKDEALAAGKERERQLLLRLERLQAELAQSRRLMPPSGGGGAEGAGGQMVVN